jgi:hypothetical protein
METVRSSERLAYSQNTAWRNNPAYHPENLKSYCRKQDKRQTFAVPNNRSDQDIMRHRGKAAPIQDFDIRKCKISLLAGEEIPSVSTG